jgi:hypothetical protein
VIETATPWEVGRNAGYRREPARPEHLRPPDFSEKFDASTIFYDCFRISPTQVMLLGPPLLRFAGVLDSLEIEVLPGRRKCAVQVEHKFTTAFGNKHIHNICRVLVDAPSNVTHLSLRCAAGETIVPIAPKEAYRFKGRRVLLTLSRDNDPVWICDWMRFHRDVQHADAVLLYDNGSTAYSLKELLDAMHQVSGFVAVSIVQWPYKYGPQGVGRGTWDSAFCQDAALEDARWRFLQEAYAVLSCDVDELTLCPGKDVFELAANSADGYVKFAGRWVNAPPRACDGEGCVQPRHRESTFELRPRWRFQHYKLRDTHLSPPKWAVAPSRCPQEAHWSVHEIVGMRARTQPLSMAAYRHFQQISTRWKKTRAHSDWSEEDYQNDHRLEEAFSKVCWSD